MDDLAQGRAADHDRKIAAAARELSDCDAVMLAPVLHGRGRLRGAGASPLSILSSPDCAVLALMQRMRDA
jgi:hypothetical protein